VREGKGGKEWERGKEGKGEGKGEGVEGEGRSLPYQQKNHRSRSWYSHKVS